MAVGDELLHIIPHHKPVSPQEIRNYLPLWINKHHKFMEKISQDILQKKKLSLDNYVKMITLPGVPVDEIGLLILATMYHLKLCVLLKHHSWCALNGSYVANSELVIAFHGKLLFSDTRSRNEKLKWNSIICDEGALWIYLNVQPTSHQVKLNQIH